MYVLLEFRSLYQFKTMNTQIDRLRPPAVSGDR